MKDLTQGPVSRHLVALSGFVAISMVFQTMYFLADLYWVGSLGKESVAAVSLAGSLSFFVLALTQMLAVGALTLVSHAVGADKQARAVHAFNQAYVLSLITGVAFAVTAYALRGVYMSWLGADAEIARLGRGYLNWFIPALLLQFLVVAMGSSLRGTGIVRPTMVINAGTVALNIVLAPVLIFGWGTGRSLGVSGAAVASLISIAIGVVTFFGYFLRSERYLRFDVSHWRPEWTTWRAMMKVGAPAAAELLVISIYLAVVQAVIRPFGAAAQAGFGIAIRVMQSSFLPVVAIGLAAAPLAGQNFGARNGTRVRQSFRAAVLLATTLMLIATALSQLFSRAVVSAFSREPAVIAIGADCLRIVSWNFVSHGIAHTTSSIFQGLGHTVPPLVSSSLRLVLFAVPVYLLSLRAGFEIREVWYLSIVSVTAQAVLNLLLLQRALDRTLKFGATRQKGMAITVRSG